MSIHTVRVAFKTAESRHTQVCVFSSIDSDDYLNKARSKVAQVGNSLSFIESEQWTDGGKRMLSSEMVSSICLNPFSAGHSF